jgi:hypothetical protein
MDVGISFAEGMKSARLLADNTIAMKSPTQKYRRQKGILIIANSKSTVPTT